MWQTIIVILIVALAAGLVVRHLARQLTGKEAACCGGGAGEGQTACASCAASACPQPLDDPDRRARGQACACGCAPADSAAPKS